MELSTFISETLKGIFEAIDNTQEFAKKHGGRVNPVRYKTIDSETVFFGKEEYARPLTMVQFDIAVTISNQSESGVGGGIKVMGIDIGGKSNDKNENEIVSRIRFEVGCVLPHTLT